MGVKVQYNPSTGKASYNPATGKVQVVVAGRPNQALCIDPTACVYCSGDTPYELRLTFSGILYPTDCCDGCLAEDILDPNDSFVLCQVAPCEWRYTSTGSKVMTVKTYPGSVCTGTPDSSVDYDTISIIAGKGFGNTLLVQYSYSNTSGLIGSSWFTTIFLIKAPDSGCMGHDSVANGLIAENCQQGPNCLDKIGYNGTVKIEEV